jgi:hypothetical protein
MADILHHVAFILTIVIINSVELAINKTICFDYKILFDQLKIMIPLKVSPYLYLS